MAEKIKIPEIRFKGFSEEWEERKYSKTFTKVTNNTLSRADLNYKSGLAKNVHYGDVLIKYGELLNVEKDEIPYITDDTVALKLKSSKLQNGDVVIADAAEDEMVGKCTELINIGEEIIVSGLHTIPSRPMLSFASGYLGYFMNAPAYHTQLLRLMQGTKVLSISKAVLQDTAIIYPIDKEEQSQIGTLFSHLDHLITLRQRKYNKLVTIKKAMLEKMFPQNGARVPEIRFKGFTEEWEERKLKGICNYQTSTLSTTDAIISGKYNLYDANQVIGFTNSNIQTHDYITIIKDGSGVGRVRLLPKNTSFIGTMGAFHSKNSDINFLLCCLINTDFSKHITGATIPHIYFSDYGNDDYYVPNIQEQSKIGNYFKNLDNLITLKQRELEKLKNIKKACLEKMFV